MFGFQPKGNRKPLSFKQHRPPHPPPELLGERQRDPRPSGAGRGPPGLLSLAARQWPGLRALPLSGVLLSPSDRPLSPPSPSRSGLSPRYQPTLAPVCLSVWPGAQPPATGLDGRAEATQGSRGLASKVGSALYLRRRLPCSVRQRLQVLLLRWDHALLLLLLRVYREYPLGHSDCRHRVWNRIYHGGHCWNRHLYLHVYEKQPRAPGGSHQRRAHQRHRFLSCGAAPL